MPGNIADSGPTHNWPTPNYWNPKTRSWLPIYLFCLHGFASVLVFVRLWLRLKREAGGLGLDDAFLIPAWVLAGGFISFAAWSSLSGIVDRHVWDLIPSRIWELPLSAWVGSFIFVLGTGAVKISVLLFYRRLGAQAVSRWWKYAVWGAIAFTVAYTIVLDTLLIFNCNPTEAYWRAYDPYWHKKYHCIDTKSVNALAGVFSISSDVYSVVLPCWMCRKLQIPWRQKFALNMVFCTGIVVIAASGMRTWALTSLGTDTDVTWMGFWVFFWGAMELELGIVCTCLPALRVLFKRQLRDTTRDTEPRSEGGHSIPFNAKGSVNTSVTERPIRPSRPSYDEEQRTPRPWSRLYEHEHQEPGIEMLPPAPTASQGPARSPEEFANLSLRVLEESRTWLRLGPRSQ